MFLITGCGRSGTKYMATVLRECGLDVGHEKPGKDGCVSSIWAVDDEYYPSYHHQVRPKFDVVLHQIRHPLLTIGSLMTASQESWEWNARHIPLDPEWCASQKAAYYWLYWNLLIDKRHLAYFYRIEDLPEFWPEICRQIGLEGPPEIPDVPKDLNHRDHPRTRWVDLHRLNPQLFVLIYGLARDYGYYDSVG